MISKDQVTRLNVFISSPGDVNEERDIAEQIILKVGRNPLIEPHFTLKPLRFEKDVPSAAMNPQDAVDYYMGKAKDAHVVVCIFCGRMGTPYTHPQTGERFDSGTQYEFVDAYRSNQKTGRPHVMVYRGSRDTGDHGQEQTERLNAFFNRVGGSDAEFQVMVRYYGAVNEFADELENDLSIILSRWIQEKKFDRIEFSALSSDEIVHDSSRINFDLMLPIFGREAVLERIFQRFEKDTLGLSLIGIGGVGKSRLAAEVARSGKFADGVVWHEITPTSTVEDLTNLIVDRIGADRETPADDVWRALNKMNVLLVLDNAEDCTNTTERANYVKRLRGIRGDTRVLMTSRERWHELQAASGFAVEDLAAPDLASAVQILLSMYEKESPAFSLDEQHEAFARAAHQHPRLIEYGVCWLWDYPVNEVIQRLNALHGGDAEGLLNDIVLKTIELVRARPHGDTAIEALSKLAVFRGGFTAEAAKVVLGSTDSLGLLRRYCLIGMANNRYDMHPIVLAAVQPDEQARSAHYDYFKQLVVDYSAREIYAELEVENLNIDVAFDYLVSSHRLEEALAFYKECIEYLNNRAQPQRRLEWTEEICAALKVDNSAQHPNKIVALAFFELARALNVSKATGKKALQEQALSHLRTAQQYCVFEDDPAFYMQYGNFKAEIERELASKINDQEERFGHYKRISLEIEGDLLRPVPKLEGQELGDYYRHTGYYYRILESIYRRTGNYESANAAIVEALHLYERELEFREGNIDRARLWNNIGLVQGRLSSNSTDFEKKKYYRELTIQSYTEAARLSLQSERWLSYAGYQGNVANSYRFKAHYEKRRDNLKLAVEFFLSAYEYRTIVTSPGHYSSSQLALTTCYRFLSEIEEPEKNLHHAMTICMEILKYRNPIVDPDGYASTQAQLAKTYACYAERFSKVEKLYLAHHALEEALRYRTQETSADGYGETRGELGYVCCLFADFKPENGLEYLLEAEKHFEEAVKYHNPYQLTFEHTSILANQSNLYRLLANAKQQPEYLEKALNIAKTSLEIRRANFYLAHVAESLEIIGWIYRDMGKLPEAINALREASETYHRMEIEYKAQRSSKLADELQQFDA